MKGCLQVFRSSFVFFKILLSGRSASTGYAASENFTMALAVPVSACLDSQIEIVVFFCWGTDRQW